MPAAANLSERPTAIRIDLGAIFVSMELSRSKWLITSLSPGGGEKMPKHVVAGGDLAGLLDLFAALQAKAQARTGHSYRTIVIQEAGLDGFWIHRALEKEGRLTRLALNPRAHDGRPDPANSFSWKSGQRSDPRSDRPAGAACWPLSPILFRGILFRGKMMLMLLLRLPAAQRGSATGSSPNTRH